MINRRIMIQRAMLGMAAPAFLQLTGCVGKHGANATGVSSGSAATTWFDPEHNATLLKGATLRILARSGQQMPGSSGYIWHGAPDGGACFATEQGGWIYTSNSELPDGKGGVGVLKFDATGELIDSYSILEGTNYNCAGGKTLWNTWLSCEEYGDNGRVFECDPLGIKPAKAHLAMGLFNHEAAATDPQTGKIYMTEDHPKGCLYRYTADKPGDLSAGLLEVAVMEDSAGDQTEVLTWQTIADPLGKSRPLRRQIADAAQFKGGEGIIYSEQHVYFTTKHDNKVWSLNLRNQELKTVYDASDYETPVLTGVDNIEVAPNGELLVAEDGGDMQIVALGQDYQPIPLITLHGQDESEVCGPAFSPNGQRLYFSSQRGLEGDSMKGITYELSLPGIFTFS